jgi:Domain of unknown function (DUF4335)
MESNNLTTRTYTAPTCTLIVASQNKQQSRLNPRQQPNPVDFILHLDDPDRRELVDCITLQGEPQQLDSLQQVVSKYIAELVAKFPLPTAPDRPTSEPTQPQEPDDSSVSNQLYPNRETSSTRSGLMKNLPGLRNSVPQATPTSNTTPPSNLTSKPSISKFFWGRQNKHKDTKNQIEQPNSTVGAVESNLQSTPTEIGDRPPATLYLTGSEKSLDHHLHLGDLATIASGEVITLSAIQLFDLATVLDEYVTEGVATPAKVQQQATLNRSSIPGNRNRTAAVETPATPLSQLPNLPRIPATQTNSQVYYQTRSSRSSSFISAIPWAVAAAIAVGVPLLLLDPNPNPIKDVASKLKMPDLNGAKKSVTALLPKDRAPKPDRPSTTTAITANPATSTTASVPNPTLPAPWQTQPVRPPVSPKPLETGVQPPQTGSTIGIAPLPSAIGGVPGGDLSTTAVPAGGKVNSGVVSSILPRTGSQSGVAPNPLNSSHSPSDLPGLSSITGLSNNPTTPTTIAKSGVATPPSNYPIPSTAPVIPGQMTAAQSGQIQTGVGISPQEKLHRTVPTSAKPTPKGKSAIDESNLIPSSSPIDPGKISISRQPILMPPSDLPAIPMNAPSIQKMPLNPIGMSGSNREKVAKPKVKPTAVASKPKPKPVVKPTGIQATPQPAFEPFTPVPKNPNLINPEEITPEAAQPQNPPVIPNQPLQSNNGAGFGADPADSPSLQETKRYFQGKWKANATQPNSLQYVVQVNGKSGTVRSVSPQGEAATNYLQQTKFIKPGQKLISPAAAGTSDQKIRVLLEPDGNVDTFSEP